MSQIVILGGGFGGLSAAHALRPALGRGHTVTLIDRKDRFFMGLAKLWVLVGDRSPDEGWGDLTRLSASGIRFVKADVTRIDVAARAVETSAGRHAFDHLIVAMGAEVRPDAVPGLPPEANLYDVARVPALRDALAAISRGTVAIVLCGAPYKCPPAPFEAALLADALLRKRGVRDAIEIVVTIPDPNPMPVAGPAAGAAVRAVLDERGIALRSGWSPASVDAGAREVAYANGERLRYDVLLAVPPHRAPAVVRGSGLADASGWIAVDPGTLATADPRVHAVGDVTAIKLPGAGMLPKAGIMAEAEAEVVAHNLLATLDGRAPDRAFDGAGYCFMEVGDRRAIAVDGAFFTSAPDRVRMDAPSPEAFARKQAFERERLARWFG
jgi:sulfide:quinone oxidoreductase